MAKVRTPRNASNYRSKPKDTSLRLKLLVFLVAILFFWATIGPFGLYRLHRLNGELDRLIVQEATMSGRIKALQDQINAIKTDKHLQEELVKSELGWVRDNELLYVFHGEED